MLLTEKESAEKWCPHVRIARSEDDGRTIVAGCNTDALGPLREGAKLSALLSAITPLADKGWFSWSECADTVDNEQMATARAAILAAVIAPSPIHHTSAAIIHEEPPRCLKCGKMMFSGLVEATECKTCQGGETGGAA